MVGADEGICLSQAERQLLTSPYASVYQFFYENHLDSALPDEPTPPTTTRDSFFGEHARKVGRYGHDLFFFLVIRELQSQGFCDKWVVPTTLRPWLASALRYVAQGARDFAVGWRDTGSILVEALYDATESLQNPSWDDRPVDRESPDGIRNAASYDHGGPPVSSTHDWRKCQATVGRGAKNRLPQIRGRRGNTWVGRRWNDGH